MKRLSTQTPIGIRAAIPKHECFGNDEGMAVIIALIALVILSALGLYMNINASTEVRISDNYESDSRARFAAIAGINHARAAIRGLDFNGMLEGPDGAHDTSATYLAKARTMAFRNFLDLATARALNVEDPTFWIAPVPDDGLMNTGKVGTIAGTVIVSKLGIPFTDLIPHSQEMVTTARYFLKVSDNNGEASELAGDPGDSPFFDGDNTIIVRSIGVARTLRETQGANIKRNSVAIYEARFLKNSPFNFLTSPMLVIGNQVNANFSGGAFAINGSDAGPGVATIDTDTTDGFHPADIIRDANVKNKGITGNCIGAYAKNCVGDITADVLADPKKALMADPAFMYDLVYNQLPALADNYWDGTSWVRGGTGIYGSTSNPLITYISGDLDINGGLTGAGVLVCTGNLGLGGAFLFDGLVIVVGSGNMWTHGNNNGIRGGVIVADLIKVGGVPTFGTPIFDIRGNSDITTYDQTSVSMGAGLISIKQLTFREITPVIDK